MLALTRKTGERIVIGDNIVITVVDVKGESVRLAIEAPQSVTIYRGELYDAIARENRQAAAPKTVGMDLLRGLPKPGK